jgi:hypothetical protein
MMPFYKRIPLQRYIKSQHIENQQQYIVKTLRQSNNGWKI